MRITTIWTSLASLLAASALPAASTVDFDSYSAGSAPPSPWNVTTTGGSSVAVTGAAATTGSQSLALSRELGRTARAVLPADMSAPPDLQTVISFDMNPSIILRKDYNYVSGGYVDIIRSDGYRAAGFNFDVSDTNDLSGSEFPAANELRLVFWSPEFTNEVVGYFSPGAWYHFEVTLDYDLWTSTLRVEQMGGGTTAERVYSNSYHVVPTQMNFYGADTDTNYVDSINISTIPEPCISVLLVPALLLGWRRRS